MELPISLLENSIKRGTILHSTSFEGIGHGKFFVVIGISKEYVAGFFFVNSNIHRSLLNKPEQFAMQYPLKHSDYDSFLCATDIKKRRVEAIARSMLEGVTKIIGSLKEEHLKDVIEMVRDSRLFSKKDKMDFLY